MKQPFPVICVNLDREDSTSSDQTCTTSHGPHLQLILAHIVGRGQAEPGLHAGGQARWACWQEQMTVGVATDYGLCHPCQGGVILDRDQHTPDGCTAEKGHLWASPEYS